MSMKFMIYVAVGLAALLPAVWGFFLVYAPI